MERGAPNSDASPLDRAPREPDAALEEDPPQLRHLHYLAEEGPLFNPERGLYQHWERRLSDAADAALTLEELARVRAEGISLLLMIFDLAAFYDRPLSQPALAAIEADLNRLREGGLKAILRFRYSADPAAEQRDAAPAQTAAHIEALRPLFERHQDVILLLQAGFIGAWGEWYYSDHWGDEGRWSEEDRVARRALVDQLLEALPGRAVQLRTPAYRWRLYGEESGCAAPALLSRLGYHNDCFLASASDFGTYQDPEREYPWLEAETRCVPMGGESCAPSGERSACPTALRELSLFHWSYLNRGYHPEVIEGWRRGGCWAQIQARLGYRLSLIRGDLPEEVAAAVPFPISLTLLNQGYAAPLTRRSLWLILEGEAGEGRWGLELSAALQGMTPELGERRLELSAALPREMPPGRYRWTLSLPDPAPRLAARRAYAIRLANSGLWRPEQGVNDLNLSLERLPRRTPAPEGCPAPRCFARLPDE